MSLEGFGRRGLDLMFYSGAARALSPICRGVGAILQLNNVRPGGARPTAVSIPMAVW